MANHVFTSAQAGSLKNAIALMTADPAPEIPFDANVIDAVTLVANSVGYVPKTQQGAGFKESAQNAPISTLLNFVLYMGGP